MPFCFKCTFIELTRIFDGRSSVNIHTVCQNIEQAKSDRYPYCAYRTVPFDVLKKMPWERCCSQLQRRNILNVRKHTVWSFSIMPDARVPTVSQSWMKLKIKEEKSPTSQHHKSSEEEPCQALVLQLPR